MLRFLDREPPLPAGAVIAQGEVARRLAARLLTRPAELPHLAIVATGDVLVVLGATELLPWVDGVQYLGKDPDAAIYLPTVSRPELPAELVARAITLSHQVQPPFALLPERGWVIPLGAARSATAAAIGAWLQGAQP